MSYYLPQAGGDQQGRQHEQFARAKSRLSHDDWHHFRLEMARAVTKGHHQTRLCVDPRRDVVWRSLWRFHFLKLISPNDCVLDLGCGYGDFINNVVARRRIAVDSWEHFPEYVDPHVERVVGSVTDLAFIEAAVIDFAFASNLFEHLSQVDFARVLEILRTKLNENGTLNILQPNYRYAYAIDRQISAPGIALADQGLPCLADQTIGQADAD